MTKTQIQSVAVLVVVLVVISIVSYLGLKSNAEENVIRSVFTQLKSESRRATWNERIAVLSKPSRCHIYDADGTNWEDIPKQVVREFIESNSDNAEPIKLTSLEGFVPIVKWEDNKRLYRAGYSKKPQDLPVLGVSRVGLNFTLNKAVMCVERIVPSTLGGFAYIFYLEKKEGKWIVKMDRKAWVS